jgi:hypothetical protein
MRQESKTAFVFWTQWIWHEAWSPTVRALAQSSLISRLGILAFIVALSGFWATEGAAKAADQIKWFLWYNLIGAVAVFCALLAWNLFLAPGHLLAREVTRDLVRGWVIAINGKIGESGRLIESIRLGEDISTATKAFEQWREETRRLLN